MSYYNVKLKEGDLIEHNSYSDAKNCIAINLSSDPTIVLEVEGKIRVIELTRYFKCKSYDASFNFFCKLFSQRLSYKCSATHLPLPYSKFSQFYDLINFIKNLDIDRASINDVRVSCALNQDMLRTFSFFLKPIFKNATFNSLDHRLCHAHSVYGTTDIKDSLSIVSDGGGNGNFTVIHHLDNFDKIVYNSDQNFGSFYNSISTKVLLKIGISLEYGQEGIFMGFSGYGKLDSSLFKNLFMTMTSFEIESEKRVFEINKILEDYKGSIEDFSYTFQKSWVKSFMLLLSRFKGVSQSICLSGGCFLNCELNRSIIDSNWFKKVFFTPLASDCGQGLGAFLMGRRAEFKVYNGDEIYDKEYLLSKMILYRVEDLDVEKLAHILYENNIVGYIAGNMESGPRALGNRSIFANPCKEDMKQILNERVKHRHWFRPYGAIIKRESLSKYFDLDKDLPYMNVLTYNKTKFFPAITHVDNSTRIQTITENQNKIVFNILSEFEKLSGYPILINTSFNVRGQPIINWCEDALKMLDKKEIDYLVIDNYLITSK